MYIKQPKVCVSYMAKPGISLQVKCSIWQDFNTRCYSFTVSTEPITSQLKTLHFAKFVMHPAALLEFSTFKWANMFLMALCTADLALEREEEVSDNPTETCPRQTGCVWIKTSIRGVLLSFMACAVRQNDRNSLVIVQQKHGTVSPMTRKGSILTYRMMLCTLDYSTSSKEKS